MMGGMTDEDGEHPISAITAGPDSVLSGSNNGGNNKRKKKKANGEH
jgi:hypothetical protein